MGIDISNAGSRQRSMGNKFEYLIGVGHSRFWKRTQIFNHLGNLRHMAERQFSQHKRMHDDIAMVEKSSQPGIAATKMVDPDRCVGENHR